MGIFFVELLCGILSPQENSLPRYFTLFFHSLCFTSTEFHSDLKCHIKYPPFFTLESLQDMSIRMISECSACFKLLF
jgi:hypothetical protein